MKQLLVKNGSGFWISLIGLIGVKKPYPLVLHTRFGIHTFGLRFPIDVLILDSKNRVVVLKKNLHPNRLFFWYPKWSTVLELPTGTIEKEHIHRGIYVPLSFS